MKCVGEGGVVGRRQLGEQRGGARRERCGFGGPAEVGTRGGAVLHGLGQEELEGAELVADLRAARVLLPLVRLVRVVWLGLRVRLRVRVRVRVKVRVRTRASAAAAVAHLLLEQSRDRCGARALRRLLGLEQPPSCLLGPIAQPP